MKPVSQAFMDAWQAKQGKQAVLYVQYKRRFWNESAIAYQYEANWTQFTMRDFVTVGNVTFKLDTPLLNEIKTSSVILKFKNSDYQLLPANSTTGLFRPDAASVAVQPVTPTRGYHPFLTQFRVLFGYKKADGTIETTELFTGVAIDYFFNVDAGYCEVTVSGNEFLLQSTNALAVSTTLTGAATTAAGGNKFTTNATGIANIPNVYDSGRTPTLLAQGTDYTLSGLSQYGVGASIQLNAAAVGTITYDGSSWYTLKKIEDLVTLLAQAANVQAYNISPVVFPGASGAATTYIGQFSGSTYSPPWTAVVLSWAGSISGSAGVLTVIGSDGGGGFGDDYAYTAATPAYGVWTFPMSQPLIGDDTVYGAHGGSSPSGYGNFLYFIASTHDPATLNGYALLFSKSDSSGANVCYLHRVDSGAFTQLFAVTAPSTLIGGFGAQHNWTLSRGPSGLFNVFADDILIGTATDNTHTTSAYTVARSVGSQTNTFGPGGDQRSEMAIGTIVNQTAVELTMADFTGMTCYDAVQKLAKLADYEWGFDSTGTMFFRSKAAGTVVMQPNGQPIVINQSDGISKILEFRPGYAEVINDAQVTSGGGQYYREYNSTIAGETAPTSQQTFLTQLATEDYSDFLLVYDPIIAAGRAQSIWQNNSPAKRMLRFRGKIMPFLELSDVISPSFYNNPRMADNIFGDPLEKWGISAFGKPMNVLMRDMPGKLLAIIFDPNTCMGEYQIQEVLS